MARCPFAALPHVCVVLWLCAGLCRVCALARTRPLQDAVQTALVDVDGVGNLRRSGVVCRRKHARRPLLADVADVARDLQRLHGLRVWLFLWPHAADQTLAEKDLGRLYWRRHFNAGVGCSLFVVSRSLRPVCVPARRFMVSRATQIGQTLCATDAFCSYVT